MFTLRQQLPTVPAERDVLAVLAVPACRSSNLRQSIQNVEEPISLPSFSRRRKSRNAYPGARLRADDVWVCV